MAPQTPNPREVLGKDGRPKIFIRNQKFLRKLRAAYSSPSATPPATPRHPGRPRTPDDDDERVRQLQHYYFGDYRFGIRKPCCHCVIERRPKLVIRDPEFIRQLNGVYGVKVNGPSGDEKPIKKEEEEENRPSGDEMPIKKEEASPRLRPLHSIPRAASINPLPPATPVLRPLKRKREDSSDDLEDFSLDGRIARRNGKIARLLADFIDYHASKANLEEEAHDQSRSADTDSDEDIRYPNREPIQHPVADSFRRTDDLPPPPQGQPVTDMRRDFARMHFGK